jgi:hypothetical protein
VGSWVMMITLSWGPRRCSITLAKYLFTQGHKGEGGGKD